MTTYNYAVESLRLLLAHAHGRFSGEWKDGRLVDVALPAPGLDRSIMAAEMRREGKTYRQITEALGISVGRAQDVVAQRLRRTARRP